MVPSDRPRLDMRKGAAPLPLGLAEVLALNLAAEAVAVGYASALFRRDLLSPLQSIANRLVWPVAIDLASLLALGLIAARWTRLPKAVEGTFLDRQVAAGAPLWLGYGLALAWLRVLFVGAYLPATAPFLTWLRPVFEWTPAYRGLVELDRWARAPYAVALAFALASGWLGWVWARRSENAAKRLLLGFRVSLVVCLIAAYPAAQRAYLSWRPAVAGDELIAKLVATPRIGGPDWQPTALRGRLTLVEFWTTWCGACKRLLPELSSIAKAQRDPRFSLLLVNLEGRGQPGPELMKKVSEYKAMRAPDHEVLVDRGAWSDAVGVTVYPTLALIGPDGRLVRLWSGTPSIASVEAEIKARLTLLSGL